MAVDWNMVNDLLLSGGEDCTYRVSRALKIMCLSLRSCKDFRTTHQSRNFAMLCLSPSALIECLGKNSAGLRRENATLVIGR